MDARSYAAGFRADIDVYEAREERSRQTELGVSDIGVCREKARRIIAKVPASDAPSTWAAFSGKANHDRITMIRREANPHMLFGTELRIVLPSGIEVLGHLDELDPLEPSVTDYKTKTYEGLELVRRTGVTDENRYGRMLYYLGAYQAGLVPAEGIVRNIYLDRSGKDPELVIQQEPFSMDIVYEADLWLQDVHYAAEHDELAPLDKHFSWCETYCEFFRNCRQVRTGKLVEGAEATAAARVYLDATQVRKRATAARDGARASLGEPVAGENHVEVAGDVRLAWIWVNHPRTPYHRLEAKRA